MESSTQELVRCALAGDCLAMRQLFAHVILWHGGEAQAARDRFTRLSREDRGALLCFLDAL
jgi:CxxC motif-containing protein (DUF1111 family)